MRNGRVFPGIIFIGFGIYFFLQQANYSFFKPYYTWPTLLIIVGIAFLCQGYFAKDYEGIFPGVILTGFGLHFHIVNRLDIWPDHIGTFILIIALAFLLRHQKVGNGFFIGILFLILALFLLFYDKITKWFGVLENGVSLVEKFWPILFVCVGAYFLFVKKK